MIDLTYNLKCYYVCRIYLVIATLHFICIVMKKIKQVGSKPVSTNLVMSKK